jgi:hypothetical protein
MPFSSFITKLNRRDTPIFPRFSKTAKIIFSALIVISVSLFAIHALADNNNVLEDTINGMQTGGNLESWLGKDSIRINSVGMFNALTDIQDAPTNVINGTAPAKTTWIPGGFIGSTTNLVAYLYTPPASGIEYLAQMKNSFLGTPAYAQSGGIGFQGLQPVLPIWRAFRNVVYVLSSLVFIIIGLMIMLRVKISPQAVINIQNAIPQLVTALILVTFSYAIAGLIIDLAYVLQGIFIAAIFTGMGKGLASNLLSLSLIPTNFANLNNTGFWQILWLGTANAGFVVVSALGMMIGALLGGLIGSPIPIIGTGIGTVTGGLVGGVIFLLIVTIFIIIQMLKFMVGLIKCYVTLIIKIVIAPLEIGMGALPNSKIGFSTWIMDVIANIAVFPVSLIFIILLDLICDNANGLWAPSIIGFSSAHIGPVGFLSFFIAIGGLMLLPKLPEMIPEFIFMIKPSPWGKAIGEGMNELTHNQITNLGGMAVHSGVEYGVRPIAESYGNKLLSKIKGREKDRKANSEKPGEEGRGPGSENPVVNS